MFPQPPPAGPPDALDALDEALLRAVRPDAVRVVVVGGATGRLAAALEERVPGRRVTRLAVDQVAGAPVEPGTVDAVLLSGVLERLVDPEAALRAVRPLLAPGGEVLARVPNAAHHEVLGALLRSDLMYQPEGLLDAAHLRFFSHATLIELLLDAGYLPEVVERLAAPAPDALLHALVPALRHYRVSPEQAAASLGTHDYVLRGTPDGPVEPPPSADEPLTVVVLVNDEAQLRQNLLRSPCLAPGTPHELVLLREQTSAAAGVNRVLDGRTHGTVVVVQQDVYLPRGWDSRFLAGLARAEREVGPLGVAGVFGLRSRDGVREHVGRAVDRDKLLVQDRPLPAEVDSVDEIVLAFRAGTPVRLDPGLGFHLYGVDLCLKARREGLAAVVVDAPVHHNSLFQRLDDRFHDAREHLLATWPEVDPLATNMGDLRRLVRHPAPLGWDQVQERELAALRAEVTALRAETIELRGALERTRERLERSRARVRRMEQSPFWRARGAGVRLLGSVRSRAGRSG